MSLFDKFRTKNEINSSLGVTCVADGKCYFRHTTLCEKCKNNIGYQRDKSYFAPKERD